ncbi:MAG TPA: hypothetical protein VF876_11025 [Burkholderiales bacterium]
MKTFANSLSQSYADWSALSLAMVLGHAPASSDKQPNAKPAQAAAVQGWEHEGGSLQAPKKAAARPGPVLRKAAAKKRPAKKANRAKRR